MHSNTFAIFFFLHLQIMWVVLWMTATYIYIRICILHLQGLIDYETAALIIGINAKAIDELFFRTLSS